MFCTSLALGVVFSTLVSQAFGITLTPSQKLAAETITNIFEYDKIQIDYVTCEDIHDGRGYTAGRSGFTTATADALEVIKAYNGKFKAEFNKYIPRLEQLAKTESGSTSGLSGYCNVWKKAAQQDAVFRKTQDAINDKEYYKPALALGNKEGVRFPLSAAFLYDTCIQHGNGNDKNSLGAIIKATDKAMGGSPASGKDEKQWLTKAIAIRKQMLKAAGGEWAKSANGRCDALAKLAKDGNYQLKGKIVVKSVDFDHTFTCTDVACKE